MAYRVGADIGGSFTDFAIFDDQTLEIRTLKVFSRPDRPGAEVMAGIEGMRSRYAIEPASISYFTHGTTVGINTVIQRKGLKLALIATRHFADVLDLARLRGPNTYDLLSKRPAPLITRDMVFEVDERMRADGSVELVLDDARAEAAIEAACRAGAEGVVVSLLHSYRNAAHERRIGEIAARLRPGLPIFLSSQTWPIIREYERTVTATIGGYVQPRVSHYLTSLQRALKDEGVTAEPRLTKSNGGVMTAEQGKRECVQMILSGTASGVIGASYVASQCGLKECMSLDIGGTSADVALILDGQPQYGDGELIGDFRIFIPSVSVSSIGEGGGSIAWVDGFGVLQVGPESAGSSPGPACYGRGGTRPTITDAFAALGMLGGGDLGYNAVQVDVDKSRVAIASIAEKLGRTVEETAAAMIDIAVSGMYAKISGLVSRFGVDPRTISLLAFGGAGPMMGCFVARELGVEEVVVPTTPGVLSALGGLIADLKNDFIKTVYADLDAAASEMIREGFAEMRARALAWLHDEQGFEGEVTLAYSADIRYRGQSFELEAGFDEAAAMAGDVALVGRAFNEAHERIYGHSDAAAPLQIINLRLVVSGVIPKPALPRIARASGAPEIQYMRDVWFDGARRNAPFYRRDRLLAGHLFYGPAIVTQDDCTTCIPPGFRANVDEFGNLRIKEDAA